MVLKFLWMPNLEGLGFLVSVCKTQELFHVEHYVVTGVYVQRWEECRGKRLWWLGLWRDVTVESLLRKLKWRAWPSAVLGGVGAAGVPMIFG